MIILCYHELCDNPTTPWELKPEEFREHLEVLQERGYRDAFIPDIEYENAKDKVAITFDDGRIGCVLAADILAEIGWNATFYITTGFINGTNKPRRKCPTGFMTWDQINHIDLLGNIVAAHSVCHAPFDELTTIEIVREMCCSKQEIERHYDRECGDFATPHGFWSEEVAELAEILGFSTLVTTEFGANKDFNPYRLQRWEVHSPCPREEFERKLDELEAML